MGESVKPAGLMKTLPDLPSKADNQPTAKRPAALKNATNVNHCFKFGGDGDRSSTSATRTSG